MSLKMFAKSFNNGKQIGEFGYYENKLEESY